MYVYVKLEGRCEKLAGYIVYVLATIYFEQYSVLGIKWKRTWTCLVFIVIVYYSAVSLYLPDIVLTSSQLGGNHTGVLRLFHGKYSLLNGIFQCYCLSRREGWLYFSPMEWFGYDFWSCRDAQRVLKLIANLQSYKPGYSQPACCGSVLSPKLETFGAYIYVPTIVPSYS